MKISEITAALEKLAPLAYAEDFDNTGLLVGNQHAEVSKILVTHDTLETVVDEAIEKGANLIVSFHPILFTGLKKITGKTYVERVVMKAIQHEINIYATHTALDNSRLGVNYAIAQQLELKNSTILLPKKNSIFQLVTYVPKGHASIVRKALAEAGAGSIGNYDACSFNVEGIGTFRPNNQANPYIGEIGKIQYENEIRISVIFEIHKKHEVLKALLDSHPYEEVAYEVMALENENPTIGMGMIGELENAMSETDFIQFLKEKMKTAVVRHSALLDKPIQKVAVLGGSGSFAIPAAIGQQADAFVTADLKYHDFYQAENKILLTDIGHYESERYTKDLLSAYLSEKFPNFAVLKSEINTNPVHYS